MFPGEEEAMKIVSIAAYFRYCTRPNAEPDHGRIYSIALSIT
jgi:hypothetical protein